MLESDNKLLERYVQHGDHEAFEQIVRRYYRMVFGMCSNMLSKREDAEDAFQMIFMALSTNANKLKSHENVCGWLHETSLRTCLGLRRKSCRKREITVNRIEEIAANGHWQRIATQSELEKIHHEIVQLPSHYRNVIILCHLEGKSRAQAAKILNTTTASIKSTLNRARKLLRIRLLRCGIATTVVLGTNCAAFSQQGGVVAESLIQSTLNVCFSSSASATAGAACLPHALIRGKLTTVSNFAKTALLIAAGVVLVGGGLFSLCCNRSSLKQTTRLEIIESDSSTPPRTQVSLEFSSPFEQESDVDGEYSYADTRQLVVDESMRELANVLKREFYLRVDFNRRHLKLRDEQVNLLRIFAAGFAEKRAKTFEKNLVRKLNELALDRFEIKEDHGGVTINENEAMVGIEGGRKTQIDIAINRHEAGGRVSITLGSWLVSSSDFKATSQDTWAFERSPSYKRCLPSISDDEIRSVIEAEQALTLSERQYFELHKTGLDEKDQRSRIIQLIGRKLASDLLVTEDQTQALNAWLAEHVSKEIEISANTVEGLGEEENKQTSSITLAQSQMYSIDAELPDCFSEIQQDLFRRAKRRYERALGQ